MVTVCGPNMQERETKFYVIVRSKSVYISSSGGGNIINLCHMNVGVISSVNKLLLLKVLCVDSFQNKF